MIRRYSLVLNILYCAVLVLLFWPLQTIQAGPWYIDLNGSKSNFTIYRDRDPLAPIQSLAIGHIFIGDSINSTAYIAMSIKLRDEKAVYGMKTLFSPHFSFEYGSNTNTFVITRPPSRRMLYGFCELLKLIQIRVQYIDPQILSFMIFFLEYCYLQAQTFNWQQQEDARQLELGLRASADELFHSVTIFKNEDHTRPLPKEGWTKVNPGTILPETDEFCPFCAERFNDGIGADLIGDFGGVEFAGSRDTLRTKCGQYACRGCLLRSFQMIPRCPFCRTCMPGLPAAP